MSDNPLNLAAWHRVLRPMRSTVERWIDTGHPAAFPTLAALAKLNGRASFWQGRYIPEEYDDADAGRGRP